MGKLVKPTALVVSAAIVLYAIVLVRGRLDESYLPAPLSVEPSPVLDPRPPREPRVSHQPTILEARPAEYRQAVRPVERPTLDEPEGGDTEPEPAFPIEPAVPYQPAESLPNQGAAQRIEFPMEGASLAVDFPSPQPAMTAEPRAPQHAAVQASHVGEDDSHRHGQQTWRTGKEDSLWNIALVRYGNGSYYHALFASNRDRIQMPDRLPEGLILETPQVEVLRQRFPQLCPDDAPADRTAAHAL